MYTHFCVCNFALHTLNKVTYLHLVYRLSIKEYSNTYLGRIAVIYRILRLIGRSFELVLYINSIMAWHRSGVSGSRVGTVGLYWGNRTHGVFSSVMVVMWYGQGINKRSSNMEVLKCLLIKSKKYL